MKSKVLVILTILLIVTIATGIFVGTYYLLKRANPKVDLNNLHKIIKQQERRAHEPFTPIVVRDVLTREEISNILGSIHFAESQTIGSNKNRADYESRISETAWYQSRPLIDKLIHAIDPNKDYRYCEQIQVVKYTKGGFFKPHQDSIADPHNNFNLDFQKGGHREYTLLISLSDPSDYEGGHTVFPNLDKKYKLKKGEGLLFRNIDTDGNIRDENLHGGDPIMSGTKLVCNLWTHVLPYKE